VRFFKVMMAIGTSANVSTCRSFSEENGRCQDQRRDRRLPGAARYGNRTSEPAGFDCRRGVGSAPPHGRPLELGEQREFREVQRIVHIIFGVQS
jgi:hypothetical protein